MSHAAIRAKEFGALLRSRRERLQPADVDLPEGSRRRTRGLRREEVAQLAAISSTYYAYLEQGRELHPSRQVVEALATALRLDAVERAHVQELLNGAAKDSATGAEELPPAVVALVDRLDPCPTYVTGRHWDVLASNRAARALWTDWPWLPPGERNMLWWTFTAPAARDVLADWPGEAAALLGRFRSAAARHPGDPAFGALVERLNTASPEFRAWWPRHDIAPLSSGTKLLRHPSSASWCSPTWCSNWPTTPTRNWSRSQPRFPTWPASPRSDEIPVPLPAPCQRGCFPDGAACGHTADPGTPPPSGLAAAIPPGTPTSPTDEHRWAPAPRGPTRTARPSP